MTEDEQTLNAFPAPNRRDAYLQARAATPEQKGLSYTDLLFNSIFGGAETPEQTSQEENSLFSRPQIDGYYYDPAALPLGADPETDISWGGEGGFKTRRTKSGVVYEIQPMSYTEVSPSERKANLSKNLGAAYEAVTEDPLGTATGLAKGVAEGFLDSIKAVSSPNATPRDVMNVSSMVMGASAPRLLDGYDPNVTRIFGGENARNFPRSKVARAQRLLNRGEDPQKVYEETTIQYLPQRGGLSRPVFNIDPKGASIRDFDALKQVIPSTSKNQVTKGRDGTVRLPIKDVVDFSEFYDNYPQIEGFEVVFDPTLIKDTASFDAKNKTLSLSLQNLEDDNPDKIRSIVLHELQHGVQAVERASGGANPSYFLEKTKKIDPVTGLEKPGPWRTNSAEMYKDVVKLNSLEKTAEKARKDFEDLGNFVSPFKIVKLARNVGKTEYAFKSERNRLLELAFKKYEENPGEIESRAAQLWAELTPEERQKTLPSTVYDRAANEGYSVYARLGQEPIYGENYMPTGKLPVAKEEQLRQQLETFATEAIPSKVMQDFKVDNPGGEWLEGKQKRASEYPDRKFMVGSTTGVIGGKSDFFLPTNILKGIPGLENEKRSKGDYQYDKLLSDAKENGFDPDQKGNKIVVAVNHFGQPYLLEGNTRVAVANTLNVPKVKVEVRYWNGAEGVDGPMNPEKVFGLASDNLKSNGEKRQSFEIESQDASSIFGDGATYKLYKHPESGGYIQVLERKDGPASVISLEVPEDFRGQGIGQELQAEAMKNHPSLMGQVSSKAAATTAYRLGRRPYGNPNASLEDVFKLIDENSSVNMLTPDAQKSFGFASENSDTISTNQRYAEGGMVEEEQMNRLMQQGGMADDGMSREPVTGNNIPPGALASEVRDDVDAKLSGGEYVVPADVLRYYGVRFFEDLRSQAKQGMMEMESAGRIGGVPVDPRGVPMQGQDEELTPEEEQMLAQAMSSSSGMAEGGMAFDRADFTMQDSGSNPIDSRVYFNPSTGKKMTIGFMNGTQLATIPPGFVPWTQALQDTYNATKAQTPKPNSNNRNRSDDGTPPEPVNYDGWLDENFDAITSNPYEFGMNSLKKSEDDLNLPGLAGGLIGIVTGKDRDIQNVANANASLKFMEAQGKTDSPEYKALAEEVKRYVGGLSLIEKGLIFSKVAATGNGLFNSVQERLGETPPPTAAPAAAPTAAPTAAPASLTPVAAARAANIDPRPTTMGSQKPPRKENDRDQQGGTRYSSTPNAGTVNTSSTPRPAATTPRTRTVDTPSGPQQVRVQAGSERFAEGGLVTKPKKPRAKTKGLAGKQ